MPKTYSHLMKEIEALQAEAENLRRREVEEVIARIKEAVEVYGLTTEDLFGDAGRKRRTPVKAERSRKAGGGAPRYSDGKGNVWGGRGPRPQWLRAALAAGKQLSDFETKGPSNANGSSASARKAMGRKGKRGGGVKYRDDAGHTWSGFGPKPRWFKEALAAGRTPEDLRA
jgi:DNA-binding protein H-NS